jgi:hypothetical protein
MDNFESKSWCWSIKEDMATKNDFAQTDSLLLMD